MLKIFKLIVHFVLDVVKLLTGFLIFNLKRTTPTWAAIAMIRLFCMTRGLSNDLFSSMIGWFQKPYDLPDTNGILDPLKSTELSEAIDQMKTRGFFVFPFLLDSESCDKLEKIAMETECTVMMPDGSKNFLKYEPESPQAVKYTIPSDNLVRFKVVQELLADNSIINFAQKYLGSRPIFDYVNMWWSTSINTEPDTEAAQLYHFDMDKLKWFKIFVYLTDVSVDNGPHCFVAGSHLRGKMPNELLKKGYSRHQDADIAKYYNASDIQELVGVRGTVIAVDTRGFHKGKHLLKGHRLVFELEISNCLFGSMQHRPTLKNICSNALAANLIRWPRVYSHFITE